MSKLKHSNKALLSVALSFCIVMAVFCGVGMTPAFGADAEYGNKNAPGARPVRVSILGEGSVEIVSLGLSDISLGASYSVEVTENTTVWVAKDEQVTFTAVANNPEWEFLCWILDGSLTHDNPVDQSMIKESPNDPPMKYVAVFDETRTDPHYYLGWEEPSEKGVVTVSPERFWYYEGDKVNIKATPADGYVFYAWDLWTENPISHNPFGNMSSSETVFTMPATHTEIYAIFIEEDLARDYWVEVQTKGNGTVVVEPEMRYNDDKKYHYGSFDAGDTIKATAIPDSGYRFSGWYLASFRPNEDEAYLYLESTSPTYTFKVPDTDQYDSFVILAQFTPISSRGGSGSSGGSSGGTGVSDQQRGAIQANRSGLLGGANVGVNGEVNQSAILANIDAALAAASGDTVSIRVVNASYITPETINAIAQKAAEVGKTVILHADTLNSEGKVVGRMYVDCSQLTGLTGNYNLSVSPEDAAAVNTKTRFETWFSNSVEAINIGQNDLGTRTHFAAKIDTTNLNTETLALYSYDPQANEYTAISNAECAFDANGFLHFYTNVGGRIVVADSAFQVN